MRSVLISLVNRTSQARPTTEVDISLRSVESYVPSQRSQSGTGTATPLSWELTLLYSLATVSQPGVILNARSNNAVSQQETSTSRRSTLALTLPAPFASGIAWSKREAHCLSNAAMLAYVGQCVARMSWGIGETRWFQGGFRLFCDFVGEDFGVLQVGSRV